MNFKIEMPHVGESVTEAVIEKWLKKPGDRIEKYEPIVEVVTDKVAMEVPAPESGELLRILAGEGETVGMGAVIAEMEVEGAVVEEGDPATGVVDEASQEEAALSPPSTDLTPVPGPVQRSPAAAGEERRPSAPQGLRMANAAHTGSMITSANVGPTGGAFSDTSLATGGRTEESGAGAGGDTSQPGRSFARLSPAVRRLLDEHDVDAAAVSGSGVGGRITRADVLAFVESRDAPGSAVPSSHADGTLERPTAVRRIIAGHMSRSFREIPHAWSAVEVDVSGIAACRAERRQEFVERLGVNLTYLPFALNATAAALTRNPLLNASWQEGGVLRHGRINVGIAVAGKDGLVVPVIRDADQKPVLALAQELAGIVERARTGELALEEVSGGTFTLNNTGALGSVWGGAIINHPQAAILTTEAVVKRAVVAADDSIEARPMMNICLSFDHRVIDGAEASQFLQDVKAGLEGFSADSVLE